MKVRRQAAKSHCKRFNEIDSSGHPSEQTLQHLIEVENLSAEGAEFANRNCAGLLNARETLDKIIAKHAPDYPSSTGGGDRNVCALPLYELQFQRRLPSRWRSTKQSNWRRHLEATPRRAL